MDLLSKLHLKKPEVPPFLVQKLLYPEQVPNSKIDCPPPYSNEGNSNSQPELTTPDLIDELFFCSNSTSGKIGIFERFLKMFNEDYMYLSFYPRTTDHKRILNTFRDDY